MSDLAGLPPMAATAPAMRAPQPPLPESLPPPAPKDASAPPAHEHDRAAAPARAGAEAGPERLDPDMLVGPPPAFQASILELEADLEATIARLAATRGQREAAAAMGRPAAEAAEAPPPAEPAAEDPATAPANAEAPAAARDAARTGHAAAAAAARAEPQVPGESA